MSQWQRDERGLLYSIEPDGSRFYNPPSLADSRAHGNHDSFFRDEVWDVKTGTYKKKTNWNNIAALGAGAAVGAGAISGAVSGGGAASGGYVAGEVNGVANATTAAATTGAAATGASTAAATAAALQKAGVHPSVISSLLKDPQTYAGLAALLPSIMGSFGGNGTSPFSGDTAGLMDEAKKSLELQRHRVEQAQPVYDTLVNMSYGMSPKAYRGSAPAGYTPNAAPAGAYEYTAPQFGK